MHAQTSKKGLRVKKRRIRKSQLAGRLFWHRNGRAISGMTELHPQKMLETGRLHQTARPKKRVIYCAKSASQNKLSRSTVAGNFSVNKEG